MKTMPSAHQQREASALASVPPAEPRTASVALGVLTRTSPPGFWRVRTNARPLGIWMTHLPAASRTTSMASSAGPESATVVPSASFSEHLPERRISRSFRFRTRPFTSGRRPGSR